MMNKDKELADILKRMKDDKAANEADPDYDPYNGETPGLEFELHMKILKADGTSGAQYASQTLVTKEALDNNLDETMTGVFNVLKRSMARVLKENDYAVEDKEDE